MKREGSKLHAEVPLDLPWLHALQEKWLAYPKGERPKDIEGWIEEQLSLGNPYTAVIPIEGSNGEVTGYWVTKDPPSDDPNHFCSPPT